MNIVAALTEPRSIQAYLEGVGLPSPAPPIAPARTHPQNEFDYAACKLRAVDGTAVPAPAVALPVGGARRSPRPKRRRHRTQFGPMQPSTPTATTEARRRERLQKSRSQ